MSRDCGRIYVLSWKYIKPEPIPTDLNLMRFNRTLIAALTSLVNSDQSDWDVVCGYVAHAYNCSIHASTGITPNMLLFGEEIVIPADIQLGSVDMGNFSTHYQSFTQTLRNNVSIGYRIASNILKSTAQVQNIAFDSGTKTCVFVEGDLVARYHSPIARLKLGRNWAGPFTVKQVLSEHT